MNLDFHYYGTMLAALVAGYGKEEAVQIANAAQFVDDCTEERFHANAGYEQIATSRLTMDVVGDFLDPVAYSDKDVEEAKEIWGYFHFLPGNQDDRVTYHGKEKNNFFESVSWKFDKSIFQKLCLPESDLCQKMIQDVIDRELESEMLEPIGMYMHILADTWAHSHFAGLPNWSCNDVRQGMGLHEYHDGWKAVEIGIHVQDSPEQHTYRAARVASPRYVSPVYLGHGQMGQMPDLGYLRYKYVPVWREMKGGEERKQERDNPSSFLAAFVQMVTAMRCIKNKTSYPKTVQMEDVAPQLREKIENILRIRKLDQSNEFINLIKEEYGFEPVKYDVDYWKNNEAAHRSFCNAAVYHRNFMRENWDK
ncbi:MAG: hypothetical protein IJA07_06685 [Agathobacter sp.]|nr:hypothetical protein [Agathobacter sp.]